MQLIDRQTFRRWGESRGLGWERGPVAPRFGTGERESPWPWPRPDGHTRPWQLADLIIDVLHAGSLGESCGFYLFPPYGRWHAGDERRFYRVRDALLESLGIPVGYEGAAHFGAAESSRLAAAVFAHCFMIDDRVGDGSDDAWVYPDHGRLSLHFDDEEIVWAMAAGVAPLAEFNRELERLGWAWLRDRERNPCDWPLEYPG